MFNSVLSPTSMATTTANTAIHAFWGACEGAKTTAAKVALAIKFPALEDYSFILRHPDRFYVSDVKLALIAGVNPNCRIIQTTPLHEASSAGDPEIVALLLNANADPNMRDNAYLNRTPLHSCTEHYDLRVISLLLEAGADPNAQDLSLSRKSPFEDACRHKNFPAIDLYLQHGVRFSRHTYMKTVKERDLEMLKRILKHESDLDLNEKFKDRSTVLHYVCEQRPFSLRYTTPEFITALLESGANPDLKDTNGNTPFHLACEYQHRDVVECLVDFKAKQSLRRNPVSFLLQRELGHHKSYIDSHNFFYFLNQQNAKGQTPLHLAVKTGNKDVVEYLLENGAQIPPDADGETPLDLAFVDSNILDLFKKHTGWANEAAVAHAFEKRNFPALLFILKRRPLLSSELREKILADAQATGMRSFHKLLEGC